MILPSDPFTRDAPMPPIACVLRTPRGAPIRRVCLGFAGAARGLTAKQHHAASINSMYSPGSADETMIACPPPLIPGMAAVYALENSG